MENQEKIQRENPEKQKNLEMDGGYDKIYPCAEPLRQLVPALHTCHFQLSRTSLMQKKEPS